MSISGLRALALQYKAQGSKPVVQSVQPVHKLSSITLPCLKRHSHWNQNIREHEAFLMLSPDFSSCVFTFFLDTLSWVPIS